MRLSPTAARVKQTTMKKVIFLVFPTLLIGASLAAQMKVANYSFGKPGTVKYEHLDFWIKEGKRTEIHYSYGKDRKEVKLQYLGKDKQNGSACFKVKFTNDYVLYIIPRGKQLLVTDASGKYKKTFSWEYEGPINGIGTFCDICAQDDEDAMNLIQSSYIK
jgi:hypothetical protein